jgi:hypothetical protein
MEDDEGGLAMEEEEMTREWRTTKTQGRPLKAARATRGP